MAMQPIVLGRHRYQWPIATTALVLVSVLMFVAQQGLSPRFVQILSVRADRLDPMAWLTSMFMHAGAAHLAVNLLILWIFGIFVEARLGANWVTPSVRIARVA